MRPSSMNEAPVQPLAPENKVTAIQTKVKISARRFVRISKGRKGLTVAMSMR